MGNAKRTFIRACAAAAMVFIVAGCSEDEPSGTCDTCASEPVKYRPDDQPPGQALIPGDTYWKFTVAHEMGHIIQQRAMGTFFTDYNFGGATVKAPPKCSCDHVTSANTLHCLQSIEEPGAAQLEGFAQFFASRTWNRASETDCVFKY
jgi:hypothetical protein